MEAQNILLAEDEPIIRMIVEVALCEAGYAVRIAVTGDEAIEHLDEPEQRYVGVITDIKMPGSAKGWDVARHARERCPEIAVVYISADGEPEWAAQGVPNSVFIQKPFADSQVITALATLLNKSSIG
ncbi:MAG: response regulator [Hyphomicrobiales bacterium]|nr:MAG: response regulator [Hyphomicrobiales bacterium]